MADWAKRLREFDEYLRLERRISLGSQNQYRSITKDWVEFSLARGLDPARFDQSLVDLLLDHRAHRNSKSSLSSGSRLGYTSNLKVFCEWASAERPGASSPPSPGHPVASASAPSDWRQRRATTRSARTVEPSAPHSPNVSLTPRDGGKRTGTGSAPTPDSRHPLTEVVKMAVAPLTTSLRDVECVMRDACPVPFFGDAASAEVATVGLNPSHGEFETNEGQARLKSRLPNRARLRIGDWDEATDGICSHIAHACSHYFARNPYWRWFNPLDALLSQIGRGTLYAGGACHVDLVPWSTRPIWGNLSYRERQILLREGQPVFHRLLASVAIDVLLLNGTTVVDAIQGATTDRLRWEHARDWPIGRGTGRRWWGTLNRIGSHALTRPVRVLGWSANLQSSFVRSAVRQSMFDWVAAELS